MAEYVSHEEGLPINEERGKLRLKLRHLTKGVGVFWVGDGRRFIFGQSGWRPTSFVEVFISCLILLL